MDLPDFVARWSDDASGFPLDSAGSYCKRLYNRLQNEGKTKSLIATNFWQSFVSSLGVLRTATDLEVEPKQLLTGEKIVVYRQDKERYDLLVLVNTQLTEPRYMRVSITLDEIVEGWYAWNRQTSSRISDFNNPNLATEASEIGQPFGLIVATAPPTDLLYAPSSSCAVVAGTGKSSSAGVIVKDKAGRDGVTAALHAVGTAKNVTVDRQNGTVVATDVISDSCFIELTNLPAVGTKGSKGPLSGLLPRGNQSASFDGITSKHTNTVITSWSVELPHIPPYNQLKVYTKKDTDPGDSGSALITDDDYIAGFAFERSGAGAAVEFSSWIWADLVTQALQLEFP